MRRFLGSDPSILIYGLLGASSSPRSLGGDSDRLSDPLAWLLAEDGVLRGGLRLDDL